MLQMLHHLGVTAKLPSCSTPLDLVQAVAPGLPQVPEMVPLPASFEATHAGFQQFVNAMHSDWYASVNMEQLQGLSSALMTQVHTCAVQGTVTGCACWP